MNFPWRKIRNKIGELEAENTVLKSRIKSQNQVIDELQTVIQDLRASSLDLERRLRVKKNQYLMILPSVSNDAYIEHD